MLKLKGIYLENFKGIVEPKILALDEFDLSILSGPNGFGKTTIFDAIEICLTGKLHRTNAFSHVQRNNRDSTKAFYQNSRLQNVTIKVMFSDEVTKVCHIIIKHLDKNHPGKTKNERAFKPDAWEILGTFYTSDENNFDKPFKKDELQPIDQSFIDALFFQQGTLSHTNLYPLFNYLQQEENIYFLKKDEEEKKEQLDFLFQTQKHAHDLENISRLIKTVKATKENIKNKIDALGEIVRNNEISTYLQLFEQKQFRFDTEDPFQGVDQDNLSQVYNSFLQELNELKEFTTHFDVNEYNKSRIRLSLETTSKNIDILDAFIAQQLIKQEKFESLHQLNIRRGKCVNTLKSLSSDSFDQTVLLQLGFTSTFIDQYLAAIERKKRINQTAGSIANLISELNTARNTVVNKSTELFTYSIGEADKCPLCNTKFNHNDDLLDNISKKTGELLDFNSPVLLELEEVNASIINNYRNVIEGKINEFLTSPDNQLEVAFFERIRELRGYTGKNNRLEDLFISTEINLSEFVIDNQISLAILIEKRNLLKERLDGEINRITINQDKLIFSELFSTYFDRNEKSLVKEPEVVDKIRYVEIKYNEAKLYSLNILSERLAHFENIESQLNPIKTSLNAAIKTFKLEMIEKIKIPFYLFSGKIIQNYQQGFGIFIDMHPNTASVRFHTDNESEHDIVHHLSSGQLAVVSIAFCLSLNKVYENEHHFKFLAIDDPVQTLDDLNVHAFLELIRYNFGDYQMLLSTHEDDIANYLQYKFEKFNYKCKRINVQNYFYPVA